MSKSASIYGILARFETPEKLLLATETIDNKIYPE